MGVTVTISTNACEAAPLRHRRIVFVPSSTLHSSVSLRFFTPRSNPRCKSRLQRWRLLAMFSHLSISMPIALISLMQMSLESRSARLLILLSMTSSPCRKRVGVLPSVDCCFQSVVVDVRRRWSFTGRRPEQGIMSHRLFPMQHVFPIHAAKVGEWKRSIQYRLAQHRRQNDVEYILWTLTPDFTPEVIPTFRYGHKSMEVEFLSFSSLR